LSKHTVNKHLLSDKVGGLGREPWKCKIRSLLCDSAEQKDKDANIFIKRKTWRVL
jgi:hypothetical protein